MQALRLRNDSVLRWLWIDQRVYIGVSYVITAMTGRLMARTDGQKHCTQDVDR